MWRGAVHVVLLAFLVGVVTEAHGQDEVSRAYRLTPEMQRRIERERYFPSKRSEATASRSRWKKAWIASWAAFAAVNVVDVYSSRGKNELNPLLRSSSGEFSTGQAIAVKAAIGGGFFAFQRWVIRKRPEANAYKAFTIANAAATAGVGFVSARNYRAERR